MEKQNKLAWEKGGIFHFSQYIHNKKVTAFFLSTAVL